MSIFNLILSCKILSQSSILFFIIFIIIFSNHSFFGRKEKTKSGSIKKKGEKEEIVEEVEYIKDEPKKVELKTMIIEESELTPEMDRVNLEQQKKESILIPLKIKNQIEKIILKILYEERAVETSKLLNDKVLENAAKQKITVSEKVISLIINQMNKIEKIEFTQKEGWKIKI
ncbi:MAG: hypothetical protein ACFE8B_06800 [Candidatus Hermodarchaeota archaeon]